jgi:predicted PurR-regulated permease PerM
MNFEKLKEAYKGILFYVFAIIAIFILLKLFVFYIPFLIGFIIAEFLEPAIKWIKNKTNLTRKTSSIIVLVIFFILFIAIILLGMFFLVSEIVDVLSGLNRIY